MKSLKGEVQVPIWEGEFMTIYESVPPRVRWWHHVIGWLEPAAIIGFAFLIAMGATSAALVILHAIFG